MKKQSNSKTLKAQLFSVVAMLLVATVALGTSTYAWFVNVTTADVQQMDFQATASSSLQIGVRPSGEGAVTYKSTISNADITGAGYATMFTTNMAPASTVDTTKFFETTADSYAGATGLLTKFQSTTPGVDAVKKIPLSFKASENTKVYFGKEALTDIANLVANAAKDGSAENTAAIRKALRVAIVPAGGTTTIFQFDNTTLGDGSKTDYTGATGDATIDDATGKYKAISEIDTDGTIKTVGQQTCIITTDANSGYLATVTGANVVTAATTPLFSLKADEALSVDVFIWLEGTDNDCVTSLSTKAFGVILPFAATPTPKA